MAHKWESRDPTPKTKWFKYFGCIDLRECTKCGAVQAKHADYLWGRVVGYHWEPKVGRCPTDKKGKQK